MLARIAVYGFAVHYDGKDTVACERDGRTSVVELRVPVRVVAGDPRDVWLLKAAIARDDRHDEMQTYFIKRLGDGAVMPVELRLDVAHDTPRKIQLHHDMLDGRDEITPLTVVENLMDALPPLSPSNAVGYHRARKRIFDAYERLRPKSWSEIGIEDASLVAEFERYEVTPDLVVRSRAEGRTATNDIIAGYGYPPDAGWLDN